MSMVERVATQLRTSLDGRIDWPPNDNDHERRAFMRMVARAAIEAMREPTKEMVEAGHEQCGIYKHADSTWSAMIDAVLGERKE